MNLSLTPSTDDSADSPFIRCLAAAIEEHGMIEQGDALIVGVSGGPDSMALLHGLLRLCDHYGCRIGIAHVHHGLRGAAADQDARFVAGTARDLNLPCYEKRIQAAEWRRLSGRGIEEAGRIIRYQFFKEIAEKHGYDKIAVGHQREDAAEQMLLNLLRGSGPDGLGGIPPYRGRVIRPLIQASRHDIDAFLNSNRVAYRMDETNRDTRFARNRIRHELLPQLVRYNPRVVDTLNRLGDVMRSDTEWIDQIIAPLFEDAVISREKHHLVLSLRKIAELHRAAKRRIMRKAIREVKGNLRSVAYAHIEDLLSLTDSNKDPNASAQLHLPDRIRVIREHGEIKFSKEKKSLRSSPLSGKKLESVSFAYTINDPNASEKAIRLEEIGAWMIIEQTEPNDGMDLSADSELVAMMDWDRVEFPLTVRSPAPGDRFMPLGMTGTMKVKDFLINTKVPRQRRAFVPVLQSGDRIIWIGGMRIDERVKITKDTRTVLKASLLFDKTL